MDLRRQQSPSPSRGESLIRLATKLKYLKDSSNDPANNPHAVAGTEQDIKPARHLVRSY